MRSPLIQAPVHSTVKEPNQEYAIALANVNTNANHIANHIANDIGIAIVNAFAFAYINHIVKVRKIFIELANLFAQDQIFSRVNIAQLIADLEDLEQLIPKNHIDINRKEHQKFVDKLFKIWNIAFALTPELLNLSNAEFEEIDNHYFHINRLILDCKKVAVNISPSVWQELEDRMLRVP